MKYTFLLLQKEYKMTDSFFPSLSMCRHPMPHHRHYSRRQENENLENSESPDPEPSVAGLGAAASVEW